MFWTADRIYSQGIEQAQQRIYEFFLEIVRRKSSDEVLADLIAIFSPTLMPNHEFTFHKKLQ